MTTDRSRNLTRHQHHPRVIRALIGLLVSVFAGFSANAAAGSEDLTADLGAAVLRYEAELELIREEATRGVTDRLSSLAEAETIDEDRVTSLEKELDDLKRGGVWPSTASSALRARAQKNTEALRSAYVKARIAAASQNLDAVRATLLAELNAFDRQTDLPAWGSNLVADGGETRVDAGRSSLAVELGRSNNFRLDVEGKVSGTTGSVRCQIPCGDGTRKVVPVQTEPDGTFRLIATVLDGELFCEFGVDRSAAVSAVGEVKTGEMMIVCEGASVELKSVRTKGVKLKAAGNAGAPLARKQVSKSITVRAPKAAKPEPSAALTKGSRWIGDRNISGRGEQSTVATVASRTSKSVTLHIPAWGGCGTDVLTTKISGSRLSVSGFRYQGPHARAYREVNGSGWIKDGRMHIEYTWREDAGNLRNQSRRGSIDVELEEE